MTALSQNTIPNEQSQLAAEEKVKILLVDDREENLLALEHLVRGERIEIIKAHSGDAALRVLLENEVGLALVDVQMPEMNGFELAELMRGTQRTKNIPIIFVTAGVRTKENTFKGYESGAVDFLYKPLDPVVVRSKVAVFAELYFQRKIWEKQAQELKRAFEVLKMTEAELQRAVRSRDEFLAIASHELKTPLTPLKLEVQMLQQLAKGKSQENLSREKVISVSKTCENQLNRVISLVDILLDVTRVQRGNLVLNLEKLDFSNLVQETVDRYSDELKAVGCRIDLHIKREIFLNIDRIRMEQVVGNLLQNIVKYAPGGIVEIHLKTLQKGVARLEVQDQGAGIKREDQDRIFIRFERAIADRKNISGLGLGLYIARQIVESHSGNIFVESEPGKGSCFVLELPLMKDD
ncbi:MAG: response regulator [Deltaproteobacteria bacterium]|nr:response regulator [Deltaproteobacteria bacterium]